MSESVNRRKDAGSSPSCKKDTAFKSLDDNEVKQKSWPVTSKPQDSQSPLCNTLKMYE